ncbi:MAG: hypothetical protein R2762_23560 [Bryobacteraceae bacterium]
MRLTRNAVLALGIAAALHAQAVPTIRSVVNAASFEPATLPGGIAQGSIATAFGTGLGPATGVGASAFPLAFTLAGTSVRLTQGARNVNGIPIFVRNDQVNFIVPSTTPTGTVEVRFVRDGQISPPATVQIVRSGFGLFTFTRDGVRAVAQNVISASQVPLNLPDAPAFPGQTLIAYGTGLGPIAAADNVAAPAGDLPTPVEVLVGGTPARRTYSGRSPCCAGLDQVAFQLAENTPKGCNVPVVIRAGGRDSNTANIAVASQGDSRCGAATGPAPTPGTGTGPTPGPGVDEGYLIQTFECENGSFGDLSLSDSLNTVFANLSFSSVSDCGSKVQTPVLPAGSCIVTGPPAPGTTPVVLERVEIPSPTTPVVRSLDSGPAVTIRGPGVELKLVRGILGPATFYSLDRAARPVQTLPPGRYTVTLEGGRDIGRAEDSFDYEPVRITAPAQGATISAQQPPTIRWSGGSGLTQGVSLTLSLGSSYGIACSLADGRAGAFSIPESTWSQLPASARTGQGFAQVFSSITATIPMSELDRGLRVRIPAGPVNSFRFGP